MQTTGPCFFCGDESASVFTETKSTGYICKNCGTYIITILAQKDLADVFAEDNSRRIKYAAALDERKGKGLATPVLARETDLTKGTICCADLLSIANLPLPAKDE